jgi:serine/threonine-protein kinase mTOR
MCAWLCCPHRPPRTCLQCDTLHSLVRDYRVPRSILLNVEHRLMLHFAPDLETLSLMQKVEVFKHALAHTSGMDLYQVLWMKAPVSFAFWSCRCKVRAAFVLAVRS